MMSGLCPELPGGLACHLLRRPEEERNFQLLALTVAIIVAGWDDSGQQLRQIQNLFGDSSSD